MTDKKYWFFKSNYNRNPLFLMKELVKSQITLNCQFKIINPS